MHSTIESVTATVIQRSRDRRGRYLERIDAARRDRPARTNLPCGNLAHSFAACGSAQKAGMATGTQPNVAIISAYNDLLSAHQPYETYPAVLKAEIEQAGGLAQFAGGTPAMCDGITQGRVGMELSMFSRDIVAMSTAVALSHDIFDAALYLGVCDKIVPGLLIGALSFGHLPAIFVPAGPMPSGMSNPDKARVRQLYVEGKASRAELLDAESRSYHSPGTCTFYGTANSNQMLMEIMGLHLPGASFVAPGSPLRDAFTREAARQLLRLTSSGDDYRPLGRLVDERAIINAVVGLLATGGSTNHTMHLVAIARAAGIHLSWDDFATLSRVVPLLTRIYPNGYADINRFQSAGGMAVLISELHGAGLLHGDIQTVAAGGMATYACAPRLENSQLVWREPAAATSDSDVLRPVSAPFDTDSGLRVLNGNLGRAVIKLSAVRPEHRMIEAPAIVFESQGDLVAAFRAGRLDRDFVAVVRQQGPRACGMPELHQLTPPLGVLLDRGHRVALVTDGRMSGASGKVPAAIHVTPECVAGGPLSKVRTGDLIRLDAEQGTLSVAVTEAELNARPACTAQAGGAFGMGRELFNLFRANVGPADEGARCVGDLGGDLSW